MVDINRLREARSQAVSTHRYLDDAGNASWRLSRLADDVKWLADEYEQLFAAIDAAIEAIQGKTRPLHTHDRLAMALRILAEAAGVEVKEESVLTRPVVAQKSDAVPPLAASDSGTA